MNYRNSIENTIRILCEIEPGEQIIMKSKKFTINDFNILNNPNFTSIESQLKDLRNQFSKGFDESTMNVYPVKNKNGICHYFCLGIANKKFDKPGKSIKSEFK
jgi:hypothetical protein